MEFFENTMTAIRRVSAIGRGPLPGKLFWFAVDGNPLFPVYGPSGCIQATLLAIMVEQLPQSDVDFGRASQGLQQRDGGRWLVVEFDPRASIEDHMELIKSAIEKFNA